MGSGDHSGVERTLRFNREILHDLAPSLGDAATVRGGQYRSTLGTSSEPCVPPMMQAVMAMLGQTALTYGFTGSMKVTQGDEGQEISFAFEPTPEARELHAGMLKHFGG